MDFNSPVHCMNELLFSLVCALSSPVEADFYKVDQPQFMQSSEIHVTTLYENSQRFYTTVPDIGPVLIAKPTIKKTAVVIAKVEKLKPEQKQLVEKVKKKKREINKEEAADNVVLASFAPSKATGLLRLIPKSFDKNEKNLFVKADGNEQTHCLNKDPKLWSAMNKIRKHFGKPLVIESAYRSPSYNAALRKRSKGVAKHSQHMNCKAIDFRINGVSISTIRSYVRSLPEIGGVGTYARWVHVDTGSKRNW